METLRRIDEDITALSNEAKKKYPEVVEASERAIQTIKLMRESYVGDVMRRASAKNKNDYVSNFRSVMLTGPYILSCNHADASTKIVMMALNGLQLLLDSDAFDPMDAQNVFRVLAIQCNVGKSEIQLKSLQLITQILGNIINDSSAPETSLNDAVICNIMTIVLCLGDKKYQPLVVSTVHVSVRQIVALLFGKMSSDMKKHLENPPGSAMVALMKSRNVGVEPGVVASFRMDQYDSCLKTSMELLLKEFTMFMKGSTGHWLRGIPEVPINFALDLIFDIVHDWQDLMTNVTAFAAILKDHICVNLNNSLKYLPEDYISALRNGPSNSIRVRNGDALLYLGSSTAGTHVANIYATKVVNIARCLIVRYTITPHMVGEIETIITLLLRTLQEDSCKNIDVNIGVSGGMSSPIGNMGKSYSLLGLLTGGGSNTSAGFGDHEVGSSSGNGMNQIVSKVVKIPSPPLDSCSSQVPSVSSGANTSSVQGQNTQNYQDAQETYNCGTLYLPFAKKSSESKSQSGTSRPDAFGHCYIASHPAAMCLEALLAFFMRPGVVENMVRNDHHLFPQGGRENASDSNPDPVSSVDHEDHLCIDVNRSRSNSKQSVNRSGSICSTNAGVAAVTVCLSSTLLSICTLLSNALSIGTTAAEYDTFAPNCFVNSMMRRILSGELGNNKEVAGAVQQIHEHVSNMPTVGSLYVISLSFCLLGTLTRLMTKYSLECCRCAVDKMSPMARSQQPVHELLPLKSNSDQLLNNVNGSPLFLPPSLLMMDCGLHGVGINGDATDNGGNPCTKLNTPDSHNSKYLSMLKQCLLSVVEMCFDGVQESFSVLILSSFDDLGAISNQPGPSAGNTASGTNSNVNSSGSSNQQRNSVGTMASAGVPTCGTSSGSLRICVDIFAEWGLILGVVGSQRNCESVLSALCKYSCPQNNNSKMPNSEGGEVFSVVLRWKNIQSFTLLTQLVHVLAESISDWEMIIDSFEQIVYYFVECSTNNRIAGGSGVTGVLFCEKDVSESDIMKFFAVLERFKEYSLFISDETLVHLMTSLVSLSINTVSASSFTVLTSGSTVSLTSIDGEGGSRDSVSDVSSGSGRRSTLAAVAGGAGRRMSQIGAAVNNSVSNIGNTVLPSAAPLPPKGNVASTLDISALLNASLQDGVLTLPKYMISGFLSGVIKFSFFAAVEIAKLNAHRISCVWQMLTTHLKMLASTKTGSLRSAAVHATLDVILTTLNITSTGEAGQTGSDDRCLNFIDKMMFLEDEVGEEENASGRSALVGRVPSDAFSEVFQENNSLMSDRTFRIICPVFDLIFVPRMYHKSLLLQRQSIVVSSNSTSSTRKQHYSSPAIQLTQTDILSSLKKLSLIAHNDVRNEIIQGIYELLQSYDNANNGISVTPLSQQSVQGGASRLSFSGWLAILEIITNIPLSWVECLENIPSDEESLRPSQNPTSQWSVVALVTAFNCMKLICDELLDDLPIAIVSKLIPALSCFSVQTHDVNISLTSIELMWKVTDCVVSKQSANSFQNRSSSAENENTSSSASTLSVESDNQAEAIFIVVMKELFTLSSDARPEIRNCAIKTLFSAMLAYTNHPILSNKWQSIFSDILLPLFDDISSNAFHAMASNAKAIAPEVKKGVKITMHHSKDTAVKQWSDSYIIALRALSRIMKSCVKSLLNEEWFALVWKKSISICLNALNSSSLHIRNEVIQVSIEVLFVLLRCTVANSTSPANANQLEVLWKATWNGILSMNLCLLRNNCMVIKRTHEISAAELIQKFLMNLYEFYSDFNEILFSETDEDVLLSGGVGGANSKHFRDLTQIIVMATRQVIHVEQYEENEVESSTPPVDVPKRGGIMSPNLPQYNRVLLQLVMSMQPTTAYQLHLLFYMLGDISYGTSFIKHEAYLVGNGGDDTSNRKVTFYFGNVLENIRVEVGNFLLSLLNIMNSDNASPANGNDQIYFSHAVSSATAAAMKTKVGDNISNLLALERKVAEENGTPLTSLASSVLLLQCCDVICNRFLYNRCDIAVYLRNYDSCGIHSSLTPPATPPRPSSKHSSFSNILPNSASPIVPPALVMSNKPAANPSAGIAINDTPSSPAASIGAFISSIGKTVLGYNEEAESTSLSSPARLRDAAGVSISSASGTNTGLGVEINPTDNINIGNNCALLFRGGNMEWQRFLIGVPDCPDLNGAKEQNRWSMFEVSPLELLIVSGCIRNKLAFAANESASQPVHLVHNTPTPTPSLQHNVHSNNKGTRRRGSAPAVVFTPDSSLSTPTARTRSKVALSSAPLCHTNMLYIISCILSPWRKSETLALHNNRIGTVDGVDGAVLKMLTESSGICVVTSKTAVCSFNEWTQQACEKDPENCLSESKYPLLKPVSYSTEIMVKMTKDLSGLLGHLVTTALNTTIVYVPRSVPTSPVKDSETVPSRLTHASTPDVNPPAVNSALASVNENSSYVSYPLLQGENFVNEIPLSTILDYLDGLVVMLVTNCKLIIQAIIDNMALHGGGNSDNELLLQCECLNGVILGSFIQIVELQVECLDQCKSTVGVMCLTRKNAVHAFLTVTSELAQLLLPNSNTDGKNYANVRANIKPTCMSYLLECKRLSTGLEILPSSFHIDPIVGDDLNIRRIRDWNRMMKPIALLGVCIDNENSNDNIKNSGSVAYNNSIDTPLKNKGHIWLILSLVYQLIAYADGDDVKQIAVNMSNMFNMRDIVQSYLKLLQQHPDKVISERSDLAGASSSMI